MEIKISALTSFQKKAIAFVMVAGGSFWGGIKFCDVQIKAQLGDYQIKVNKLQKDVNDRDKTIQDHIQDKESKIEEARIAKQEADKAHAKADEAESRYRQLVAQIPSGSASSGEETKVQSVTPIDIANACDQVIENKNTEIKDLNLSLDSCFKSKTAADLAIADLQKNETDLKKMNELQQNISNDLRKSLESQNRRKWLYFAGGLLAGYYVDKSLRK